MNRMEEVAKMFGKQLGEEFTIRQGTGREQVSYFSDNGLCVCGTTRFVISGTVLTDLLIGTAVIVDE